MNLYQAARWFFRRSSRFQIVSLWMSLGILLLTAAALKPLTPTMDTVLLITIAIAQIVQMILKYRSTYWFSKGDEPRRMDQFRSGFGVAPSPEKCALIEQITGPCNDPIRNDYWMSVKEPGSTRMAEMLLESSYSTRYYAGKCCKLFLFIGTLGFAVCLLAIVVAYQLRDVFHTSDFISHLLLMVLVFFLTGDFWVYAAQYNDLSNAANEAHLRSCQALQGENQISDTEVWEIAMNYNTGVAQGPPLIPHFYRKYQGQLDASFKRNFGNLLGLQ